MSRAPREQSPPPLKAVVVKQSFESSRFRGVRVKAYAPAEGSGWGGQSPGGGLRGGMASDESTAEGRTKAKRARLFYIGCSSGWQAGLKLISGRS